jgi:hypothetical protein
MNQYEEWELDEISSPINMFSSKKDIEEFIKVSTTEEVEAMAKILEEEGHKFAKLLKIK